jgi:diadenosine tetraphosphatase ApaH/serine/threonine PP2A family protein phosphatase
MRVLSVVNIIIIILDLMWSDPEDIEKWSVSPRGAGWLFGHMVTSEVYYNLT